MGCEQQEGFLLLNSLENFPAKRYLTQSKEAPNIQQAYPSGLITYLFEFSGKLVGIM